jgi:hypothetical protein
MRLRDMLREGDERMAKKTSVIKHRITKQRVDQGTHPCWGKFVPDHKECDECKASLECEAEVME